MDGKEHSIRFINSSYDTLFRIPDGGIVEIRFPDRAFSARCEYLDDYHTKVGDTVFHICEFAELLECQNGTVRPEPEITTDKAAWQLSHREYLMTEKKGGLIHYELLTQQFQSIVQGHIDCLDRSMNQARECILDILGLSHRNRSAVPFEEVSAKAKAAARSVLKELSSLQSNVTPSDRTGKEKTHDRKKCR